MQPAREVSARPDDTMTSGQRERSSGLWAALALPAVYQWLQRTLAMSGARGEVAATYIRAQPGDWVLDIGCGPADVVDHLPAVRYVGIDHNVHYLQRARRRYIERQPPASFVQMDVRALNPRAKRFDIVLAQGVLHHFDDQEATDLLAAAGRLLTDEGRLITVDPVFDPAQSLIARVLIANDRGKHVRQAAAYEHLANAVFRQVRTHVRHDIMRVPYTHMIMECSTPLQGATSGTRAAQRR
jgi:ubiquinone/menaquinone biosynthesis C-methylase UbiE